MSASDNLIHVFKMLVLLKLGGSYRLLFSNSHPPISPIQFLFQKNTFWNCVSLKSNSWRVILLLPSTLLNIVIAPFFLPNWAMSPPQGFDRATLGKHTPGLVIGPTAKHILAVAGVRAASSKLIMNSPTFKLLPRSRRPPLSLHKHNLVAFSLWINCTHIFYMPVLFVHCWVLIFDLFKVQVGKQLIF